MVPRGWMGPQWGKPFLHVHVFILKKKSLKIFFFRTSRPISIILA
jgi:hypothetical protein